MVIYYQ